MRDEQETGKGGDRSASAPPAPEPSSLVPCALSLSPDDLVVVGEISAPHGLRGELRMRPLMEEPATLAKLPAVVLRFPDGREERRRVTSARMTGKRQALLTLAAVPDRAAAEVLRGVQIFIRRDQLPPLPPDAYYEGDLLGLQVVTEAGRDLGAIEHVLFGPANDVYETPLALIAAVDATLGGPVISVDLAARRLVVKDMAGLRKDE